MKPELTYCRCHFCRHYWLAIRTLCVRCGKWRWFRHDLLCHKCEVIVEGHKEEE